MIYTFAELKSQVLRKLDEVEQSTTEALVEDALNNAHEERCNQHPWSWMVSQPTEVTTRAGDREAMLKHNLQRLLYVRNLSNNGKELTHVPERTYAALRPTLTTLSGPAQRYVKWGLSPVARQPLTATALKVVSDNALDTGSTYRIAIKGEDAAGNERADVYDPTGTTAAAGTTGVTFRRLLQITKAAEWNGNLTVTNTAGDETYLTLMPWEMGRQYQVLYLLELPTAAETLEYRGILQPLRMVNDYDQPLIPGGNALILVYAAL